MEDRPQHDQPLANLAKDAWLEKLTRIVDGYGEFTPLGTKHFAALMEGEEDNETLVVTFETVQGIRALYQHAQPLGWDLNNMLGWHHLCIASDGDTWFRQNEVYDYFDDLIDDGFFDRFERILFYGAGPCAYAAAAFSVAAPGSAIVMIQPQATLDPRITGWDPRFAEMRRLDFSSRFGYAPDMIDAARQAYVLFDPAEHLDAMHAALFTKPHVTPLPMRRMGGAIQSDLIEMELLHRILTKAATGRLTPHSFAALYRARRSYPTYLRRVLSALDNDGRDGLAYMLARNVTGRMNAPRFQRRLTQLEAALGKAGAEG